MWEYFVMFGRVVSSPTIELLRFNWVGRLRTSTARPYGVEAFCWWLVDMVGGKMRTSVALPYVNNKKGSPQGRGLIMLLVQIVVAKSNSAQLDVGNILLQDGLVALQSLLVTADGCGVDQIATIHKLLQVHHFGAVKKLPHLLDGLFVVQVAGDCCAELVVHRAQFQKLDTLSDCGHIHVGAHSFGVHLGAVFDVHGNVVHKAELYKLLEFCRECAVSIQLYKVTKVLDFCQKLVNVGLQKWFATGKTHSFQNVFALLEKCQNLLLR